MNTKQKYSLLILVSIFIISILSVTLTNFEFGGAASIIPQSTIISINKMTSSISYDGKITTDLNPPTILTACTPESPYTFCGYGSGGTYDSPYAKIQARFTSDPNAEKGYPSGVEGWPVGNAVFESCTDPSGNPCMYYVGKASILYKSQADYTYIYKNVADWNNIWGTGFWTGTSPNSYYQYTGGSTITSGTSEYILATPGQQYKGTPTIIVLDTGCAAEGCSATATGVSWGYPNSDIFNILSVNCYYDSDCTSSQYCDKTSDWSSWDCRECSCTNWVPEACVGPNRIYTRTCNAGCDIETKTEPDAACTICPYSCCQGDPVFVDKPCQTGYSCIDNSCIQNCVCSDWIKGNCINEQRQFTRTCNPTGCESESKLENDDECLIPPTCPNCEMPGEWSECVSITGGACGKIGTYDVCSQTRINYICSAETGYECIQYTEKIDCEAEDIYGPIIAVTLFTIILITSAYIYIKKVKK